MMNRPKRENFKSHIEYDEYGPLEFNGIDDYYGALEKYCDELESQVNELIDKQEKYRWHDLRKNPTDLPTEKGRKYIITQCGNGKYIVAEWNGMYFGEWSALFSEDGMVFSPLALVDRWKEIEKFEDE